MVHQDHYCVANIVGNEPNSIVYRTRDTWRLVTRPYSAGFGNSGSKSIWRLDLMRSVLALMMVMIKHARVINYLETHDGADE